MYILVTGLYLFSNPIFSQDSSGPVLSSFSQNLNTVDITSVGVNLTIQITVTDSSNIASVSSTPSLTLSSGNTSISTLSNVRSSIRKKLNLKRTEGLFTKITNL